MAEYISNKSTPAKRSFLLLNNQTIIKKIASLLVIIPKMSQKKDEN